MNYDALFQPIKIGRLQIKNRFVQPAMESQTTTPEHTFSEQSVAYFAARAKGGFGLQITDYMAVSKDGIGVSTEAGWWDDSFIKSHKVLADAVHDNGGKIFAQLHHSGMTSEIKKTGVVTRGPSAIPSANHLESVKAFTTAECYQMVEYYKEAARRAKEAGFDGVEVHGAHFYLLGQFMSRYANKRIDEFGGDYKGRFHMAELCIKKVKEACGRDYPVSFRISTEEYLDGGSTLDDAIIYSQLAQDAGADIINISVGSGIGGNIITPSYFNPGFNVEAAARIKAKVTIPTIVVGRINDPILANYIVASGQADLVALGRQSVADSEFPNKVKEGRTEEIFQCAGCMQRCYYAKGCEDDDKGISCILNPFSGKEGRWNIKPTEKKKKIVVVGAGVAGLECAWVLAKRGHEVTIYEKEKLPGGNFRLAAVPPHKNDFARIIFTYVNLCRKYGVKLITGTEASEQILKDEKPNSIVLATGAQPLQPPIKGIDKADIKFASDILSGQEIVGRKKVLIMGGGLVGCELAEYLNQFHNQVTIVEMQPMLAKEDVKRSRIMLMKRLDEAGTVQCTDTRILEIFQDGIYAETADGNVKMTGYDTMILALGYQKYNPLQNAAEKVCSEVHVVGDAAGARNAKFAIYEGAKLGLAL